MNEIRTALFAQLERTNRSIIAYSVVTEMVFCGYVVESATIYPRGHADRSMVVVTEKGRTRFDSVDGEWFDSAGIALTAHDRTTVENAWASAAGWQD